MFQFLRSIRTKLRPAKANGINIKTADFLTLERAIQGGTIAEDDMLSIMVLRPDYFAWHKQQTKERLSGNAAAPDGQPAAESRTKSMAA